MSKNRAHALHRAVLVCLDVMGRLSKIQVKPNDPEPEELGELRRAAQALPPMDEDPFIGTSIAELTRDGKTWHREVYDRAQDWAQRVTANLADPEWRKRGQTFGMPGMIAPAEKLKTYLAVEMNRARSVNQPGKRSPGSATKARKRTTPIKKAAARPVELRSRDKPPVVRGKEKERPLTVAQYDVVAVLLTASEKGLTKDDLVNASGHADARGILRRLAASDPDWCAVIKFPQKTGVRYRIG
jgi:hypothetical protein